MNKLWKIIKVSLAYIGLFYIIYFVIYNPDLNDLSGEHLTVILMGISFGFLEEYVFR